MKTDDNRYILTPNINVVCDFKNTLRRSEPIECNGINGANYEEMFALYADGKDVEKNREIEEFLKYNPQLKADFDRWKKLSVVPDNGIRFENKELLKHLIIDWKVIRKVSIAASVVMALGFMLSLVLKFEQQNSVDGGFVADNLSIDKSITESNVDATVPKNSTADVEQHATKEDKKDFETQYLNEDKQVDLTDESSKIDTPKLNERSFIAMIEPKGLSLDEITDQEMVALEMIANAESNYHNQVFEQSEYIVYKKPKRFIGKIFEGIAHIFKSVDKSEIRYVALEALGSEAGILDSANITSTGNKSNKEEEGFFIMGIYVVKKKASDNGR